MRRLPHCLIKKGLYAHTKTVKFPYSLLNVYCIYDVKYCPIYGDMNTIYRLLDIVYYSLYNNCAVHIAVHIRTVHVDGYWYIPYSILSTVLVRYEYSTCTGTGVPVRRVTVWIHGIYTVRTSIQYIQYTCTVDHHPLPTIYQY